MHNYILKETKPMWLAFDFGRVALKNRNGGSLSPEQWLKLLRITHTAGLGRQRLGRFT